MAWLCDYLRNDNIMGEYFIVVSIRERSWGLEVRQGWRSKQWDTDQISPGPRNVYFYILYLGSFLSLSDDHWAWHRLQMECKPSNDYLLHVIIEPNLEQIEIVRSVCMFKLSYFQFIFWLSVDVKYGIMSFSSPLNSSWVMKETVRRDLITCSFIILWGTEGSLIQIPWFINTMTNFIEFFFVQENNSLHDLIFVIQCKWRQTPNRWFCQ